MTVRDGGAGAADAPPVGMFDSGVGGVSVARAFLRMRPRAVVRYVADWTFCPYGERPDPIVRERALSIARGLAAAGCAPVVVACNTASAVALSDIRRALPDVPVVGMEPAVKPAAAMSKTGVVGVLATAHTLRGELFRGTAGRYASGVRVVTAEGRGFVELVESGDVSSDRARETVARALAPLLAAGCDVVALACTHYPALLPLLREAAPGVVFVDPAEAVARRAASLWDRLRGFAQDHFEATAPAHASSRPVSHARSSTP